jgi:hypothetical protein
VPESVSLLFYALATVLFLGALVAAWITGTAPVSPRKGRAKFLSYACVGLALIAFGTPTLLRQTTEPPLPFAGTIASVQQTGGKASHATLQVQLRNGCMLTLHSDRSSSFFRAGQAVEGQYTHSGGTLVFARFLAASGRQQGTFSNRILSVLPWGAVLLGALFFVAGWLLYRRDPLGANNVGKQS